MTRMGLERLAALMDQERYTIEEVSDLLGLSVALVRRAAGDGTLASTVEDPGGLSIRREDVVRWLRRRPYAAEPVLNRMGMYYEDSNRSIS